MPLPSAPGYPAEGDTALPATEAADAPPALLRDRLRGWESTCALLLIAVVFSVIQSATQNIIGIDGYYHVTVAALMRAQGWRFLAPLDFPWLQLTILGPGRYTDHHFLFHVLQVPFTFGDPRVGAKMAAVLFAILGLYITYRFLARFEVRYPFLWIALLVACAPTFLWRQSMARTQSLSLLLIVAGLWAIFAGYPWWRLAVGCVIVGFLAAWLFNGFFFVLGAPVAAVLARRVGSGQWAVTKRGRGARGGGADDAHRLWWQPIVAGLWRDPALAALGWTVAGLALGLLLHPYFPRNVEFAFFHLLPKALPTEQPDVPIGLEWYPYSLRSFMIRVGPSAGVAVLGLVPLGCALWRRERLDWRALVLGMLALGFLAMVARSQRIIEYFPAFAVIFCAWSWSHTPAVVIVTRQVARALATRMAERWPDGLPAQLLRLQPYARSLAPWLAGVVLAPCIVLSVVVASKEAQTGTAWDTYRDGAIWLADNTPAGSRVFTTDWDDFPHMFFWNTHNTYLVGLDPTYMSLEDPERYRLWHSISAGQVKAPSQVIREQFDAPYVLTDRTSKHDGFMRAAAADPGMQVVLRTPTVIVYRVLGG